LVGSSFGEGSAAQVCEQASKGPEWRSVGEVTDGVCHPLCVYCCPIALNPAGEAGHGAGEADGEWCCVKAELHGWSLHERPQQVLTVRLMSATGVEGLSILQQVLMSPRGTESTVAPRACCKRLPAAASPGAQCTRSCSWCGGVASLSVLQARVDEGPCWCARHGSPSPCRACVGGCGSSRGVGQCRLRDQRPLSQSGTSLEEGYWHCGLLR
jgi:hypothetical protein